MMDAIEDGGGGGGARGDLSLDDLAALNDEIVALVRAGLPLEPGLTGARRDLRGRLGRVTAALAERVGRGEGLPAALEAEAPTIPLVYRAVVTAGLRSGRPAVALEGLSDTVRRVSETRRLLGLAMIYPLCVLLLAYALFLGFVVFAAPRFVDAFTDLRVPGVAAVAGLARLGDWAPYWGPIVPIAVAILLFLWFGSGRAAGLSGGGGLAGLVWIPGLGGMLAQARTADFADLLALLLEGGTNLPEAVELAADAAGDRAMGASARDLAGSLRRGETTADALGRACGTAPGAFPPLLGWLMTVGERRGAIAPALRHAAAVYRRRAEHRAEVIRTFLPTALVLAVGTTAVLVYALALFVPFTGLLNGLTDAVAGV